MINFKWLKNKNGDFEGIFERFSVDICFMAHGGWSYKLLFKSWHAKKKKWLSAEGFYTNHIQTAHQAKFKAIKKLNLFYAQQYNQKKKM